MKTRPLGLTIVFAMLISAAQAQTLPSPQVKPPPTTAVPVKGPKFDPGGDALKSTKGTAPPAQVDSNATSGSSQGAIYRSKPVTVPPPEPNSTEQNFPRTGFMSEHGPRADLKGTPTPASVSKSQTGQQGKR